MKNSMPIAPEAVAQALDRAGLNVSARAQDLSLEEFVRFHKLLEEHRALAPDELLVHDDEADDDDDDDDDRQM